MTAPEIEFRTSGHTGSPAVWLRTPDQLRAEAGLIADELVGEIEQIVSFAPVEHLFGRLFAQVLPELRGVPVHHLTHAPTGLPPEVEEKRTLFVCLPSSWLVLRHLLGRLKALPSAVALHGTGPTVQATGEVLAALSGTGFRAFELFGSTETGGIAHREITPPGTGTGRWRLLPDVEFADPSAGPGQWLNIRSPRLARRSDMATRPDTWQLPDVIHRDDRSFEFHGRASALIKVNGERINLEELATALRNSADGLDVACLPVHDPVRAEHYELFYSFDQDLSHREISARLRKVMHDVTPPRAVHQVRRIPRTATGKIAVTALYALTQQESRPALEGAS
ncbi:class I adenylate-forming enzyme family protein [Amycolatopsis sp. CB00013]|uniref:class I adenylate-forming enzyme family protein n=1 Tax=Amycolatopsis sp. CB00013 TaxID=1703945 RepID=UPI00093B7792|nr:class I adenylate-forming enzyme family protein [Amycolatopsis sp. CB00013]OKK00260.1 hypothetical protein AMK34_00985 [Amycolatopsis sp. CB00013]